MGAMLRVAVLGRESQLPGTGAMLRVAVLGHESQLPGMGAMLRVAVLGHESQLPGTGAMLRVAVRGREKHADSDPRMAPDTHVWRHTPTYGAAHACIDPDVAQNGSMSPSG